MDTRPIGIFDSGVGGLTVARAVIDLLPHESVIYFGDTARAPYGPKPQRQVREFAMENVDLLLAAGVKLVVVACNTASAAALDELRLSCPVPVVDVIDPAVRAAARLTRNRRIGVIGTAGTIGSGRYQQAVAGAAPGVRVVAQPCPELVGFVERGETTGPAVLGVTRNYLAPLLEAEVDTVILGCTHYPLLTGVLGYLAGPEVFLVSSAEWTAREVFTALTDKALLAPYGAEPRHRFLCSGDPAGFRRLGARFLGPEVGTVEHPRPERAAARTA